MKDEIDKDFYCSGFSENICGHYSLYHNCPENCRQNHRKHPTPEQFKKEYGEEWSDDGAVYVLDIDEGDKPTWRTTEYCKEKNRKPVYQTDSKGVITGYKKSIIVCACTPFPKPDDKWRPE